MIEKYCYTDLEQMPIFNWYQINEKGNLFYLVKRENNFDKVKSFVVELNKLWLQLQEQFVKHFGFSDEFLNVHRREKEIAILIARRYAENDESLETMIRIKQYDLDYIKSFQKNGNSFYESKISIQKIMGHSIDVFKCSVIEYYSYCKVAKKLVENGR